MNVNPDEIAKFSAAANDWWDLDGDLRTLHQINPLRVDYIKERTEINKKTIVDVGCGGGILSEALAKEGARVTGIDMSEALIEIATQHAKSENLKVTYQQTTVEELANTKAEKFDIVTCMEMLEHVPDPAKIIESCALLCKPGGHVFFSTINRNAKSFALAIVAAEHILKLVEKGTHHYQSFIKPSELGAWASEAQLNVNDVTGMQFNPFTGHHKLNRDVDVNFLMHTTKDS